jgi:hypothetical protein
MVELGDPLSSNEAWYSNPAKLYREVKQAREKTERYLTTFEKQLKKYHTRHFMGHDDGRSEDDLENHYHDWCSYIVPKISFENPQVSITTKLQGTQGATAKALHHAINRWVTDTHFAEFLSEGPAVDMQFNHGIVQISSDPIPGASPISGLDPDDPETADLPYRPHVARICQDLYFEDALVRQKSEVRFKGHMIVRDRRDVIQEAKDHPDRGWNLGELQALDTMETSDKAKRDPYFDGQGRGEIAYLDTWLPEMELDEFPDGSPKPKGGWRAHGYNGCIVTLAAEEPQGDQEKDWLRKPRPYYGPMEGPYVTFGVYSVPNEVKPLSPLVVVEEQVRDLNAHSKVQSQSAADYKRIVFINKTSSRIVSAVKSAEHHHVVPVPGFEGKNVQQVELAGITDQMIAYTGIARDRLNRNSHLDDARRGQATPGATATGIDEAAKSGDIREGWVNKKFSGATRRVLWHVTWFLHMDNRVAFPVPMDAVDAEEAGMEPIIEQDEEGMLYEVPAEPWFQGGPGEGPPDMLGLELEIELHSMAPKDQEQDRQARLLGLDLVGRVLEMAQMFGEGVDTEALMDDVEQIVGINGFARRVNVEAIEQLPPGGARATDPVLLSKNSQPRAGVTAQGGGGGSWGQPSKGLPQVGASGGLGGSPSPGAPAAGGGAGSSMAKQSA